MFFHFQCNRTIIFVITDCIVTQIIDHFFQYMRHTGQNSCFCFQMEFDFFLGCLCFQTFCHSFRNQRHIHICFFHIFLGFIQSGKLDDILYHGNQSLCFLINVICKARYILRFHHAVFHDFRKTRNAGQRCFQFMRNICCKFTAQFFTISLFCVIKEQQNHTCYQTIFCDRVCQQLITSAIAFHGHFFVTACQCSCNAASEALCTI